MYAPGTRRHIKAALRHGATIAEIIEVLKLCVVQGVQTFNLGVPILAKELADRSDQRSKKLKTVAGSKARVNEIELLFQFLSGFSLPTQ